MTGYIGLQYDPDEQEWQWQGPWQTSISLNVTGFTNWGTGHDNVPDTETCAEIDSDGKWRQSPCNQSGATVCECSKRMYPLPITF